jgi:hypothetical protein
VSPLMHVHHPPTPFHGVFIISPHLSLLALVILCVH